MRSALLYFIYLFANHQDVAANLPKLCTLPPYPANGQYKVLDPESPAPSPGDKQTSFTLEVTCDPGYHHTDDAILICWADGTVEGEMSECLPYCNRTKNEVLSCGMGVQGQETRCIAPSLFEDLPRYNPPENLQENNDNFECGISKRTVVAQVISGGRTASFEELPWHAGIYSKKTRPYMQICGGTLVTETVIISAAHCFWSEKNKQRPASDFAVAVGKVYRPWNDPYDYDAQKSDVSEIKISPYFRGSATNLQDDIALVIATTTFKFSSNVRPVCVDFDQVMDDQQLAPGQLGKVAGWGLTSEDGRASPVLKVVELPVVDIYKCFDQSDPTFHSHITSDKFCAGYQNGTAVCKGDSGGGLSFPITMNGQERYFLRGVVSGAPRSDQLCNTRAWTTFTRLIKHQHFITESINSLTKGSEKFQQTIKNTK